MKTAMMASVLMGVTLALAEVRAVDATAGTGVPQLSPLPVTVAGVAEATLDLGGVWRFNGTAEIQVPGEWVMQGFSVTPSHAGHYERKFTVPSDWKGKCIKLRCDGVYSDATVMINGRQAGKHVGGFTPFELDVTALVRAGHANTITLAVINESAADTQASGSMYACHQLGGIPRRIRLLALPAAHLSALRVATRFDKDFRNATLELDIETAGEATATLALAGPDGKDVPLMPTRVAAGHVSIPVSNPLKWDNEHPNLYMLTINVEPAGQVVETVKQRVGFRQVEIRGNQLYVNGMAVKLRGVNRHEVHPLTGRSVPVGLHRRDVELFRNANVNLIRTSHYPPDEALLMAADELGMFIECEAPFCWANDVWAKAPKVNPAAYRELTCQQTAEMVVAYRNHPSILWWSAANESRWGANFEASVKLIRRLDPTRPVSFSYPNHRELDISNHHYKNHADPARARKGFPKPIFQEEEVHLNAYNRLELATDPALRDLWGRYLREMWDDQYNTTGSLGQAIWAGIDDTFYIKGDLTVGYGTWGPIDGWRREKPEYWNMKKAYSPVRLSPPTVAGNTVSIGVENRQHFSDLSEMKIAWKSGTQSGNVVAAVPPGGKGVLSIALNGSPRHGDILELTFKDGRGFVADEFLILLAEVKRKKETMPEAGKTNWHLDKKTGLIATVNQLALIGPQLMLLPLNDAGETQMTGKTKVWTPFTAPCIGWKCQKVSIKGDKVSVGGQYDGANGVFTYRFEGGGTVEIAYEFAVTKALNPRQVGLVFTLPRDCEVFSWERKGYWDVYPEDHIARLKGTVRASEGFPATSVGPRTQPAHPWRLDSLPYGNNDFCSTKHNVIRATVLTAAGRGLEIDGQGRQHVRCWRTDEAVNVLMADYSNGGSERFLRGLAKKDDRPLKVGDVVKGMVRLRVR